jgi:hypothetical protein
MRLSLLFLAASAAFAATVPTPAFDARRYLEDVKYLASDSMKGRATGSPELEKAAAYIAKQFKSAGLRPIDGKSYYQAFSVTTNAKLGGSNQFEYERDGRKAALRFEEEFLPFNFSARGKLSGSVVFAGYGITAKEYGYDDYEGLDVKDKIVLILRHEPQEYDEKSVFAGKIYTEHAQFASKAANAKQHGASGVILINDRANHRSDSDTMEKFGRAAGPGDAGIPFVQMKAEIAEQWISAAGKTLDDVQAAIDKDLRPQSFALPASIRIHAAIDLERAVKTVHNVAGYIPGESKEYIVIGAHYDHLGLGEQFSMAPSMAGTIHPGADDNASGASGVIELARGLARQPKQKRGILFITFAGEELGLLGSSYFVNNPAFSLDQAAAMLNMDMIGRIREDKVYVGGVGTGANFRTMLEPIIARHPLKVDFSDTTGYGSSDHTSFTTRQVPVLFFFSGLHGDYHKPSDTWDKIDAPGTVKLLGLIADVARNLASGEVEKPLFVRVNPPAGSHQANVAGSSAAGTSSGSGYGPYFGSIPDFAEIPNGVKFADVREGSPAALAGLKAGDIMIEFDARKIQNLYDFTYTLRQKKPGDEVEVKVLRGAETVAVKVTLTQRK